MLGRNVRAAIVLGLAASTLLGCSARTPSSRLAPLRVGMTPTSPPFAFRQGGQVVGLEPDFARALAAALGRPLELRQVEWDGLIPTLQGGRIDVLPEVEPRRAPATRQHRLLRLEEGASVRPDFEIQMPFGGAGVVRAARAMDVYAEKHKPAAQNPTAITAENLSDGAGEYEEHCAFCHGGAKAKISPMRDKFNPPVPQLINRIPHDDDAWLFWVTKHGVRMTGMPAWDAAFERPHEPSGWAPNARPADRARAATAIRMPRSRRISLDTIANTPERVPVEQDNGHSPGVLGGR